jgi:hypothetical protein
LGKIGLLICAIEMTEFIGGERTVKGMLRSNLLLTSLILLLLRAISQEKASEEPLWHADRPSPVAIYRDLDCNPTKPACFHYYYQAPAGASLAAHRHSVAMKITVRFGRKFILMGDLDNARVQRFDAASTFTIPANTMAR